MDLGRDYLTGDKDMAQLVNEQITLVNPFMDTVLDATGVEAKFGVKPVKLLIIWL